MPHAMLRDLRRHATHAADYFRYRLPFMPLLRSASRLRCHRYYYALRHYALLPGL